MGGLGWWRDPRWTVVLDSGRLLVSAGADEMYWLDELDEEQARALHQAWLDDALPPPPSLSQARRAEGALPAAAEAETKGGPDSILAALLLLERLGIVHRMRPPAPAAKSELKSELASEPKIALVFCGPRDDRLAALVDGFLRDEAGLGGGAVSDVASASLVVMVRTGGTLLDAAAAAPAAQPHLLVDVAFHHTVSLGPLVWPGESACLQCFAGRISQAWGDPPPPPAPGASASRALVAALILEQARAFAARGTCPDLAGRAIAIELPALRTRADRVHRLPWCPRCFPARRAAGAGSFSLPWTAR